MDFEIDPKLIKFNDSVPPKIGAMESYSNDVIKKNKKVAEKAQQCGEQLSGSYTTNNTEKAVKPFQMLNQGCTQIANAVEGIMLPLLLDCSDLGTKIDELIKIKNEAATLQATINSLEAEKAAATEEHPFTRQADLDDAKEKLEQKKQEFKTKHEAAKAKLAELQGQSVEVADMEPTNGSLGYDPSIAVDAAKGVGGKDKYYDYQTGDQSITSVNSK